MSKVFFFENFFDEVKVKVLFATRKSQGTIESDLYHLIIISLLNIHKVYIHFYKRTRGSLSEHFRFFFQDAIKQCFSTE